MHPPHFFFPRFSHYIYFLSLILLCSCHSDDFTPKPRGYFRIDLPEKSYQKYETGCPFTFEFHKLARININPDKIQEPCWVNIEYPRFNATLHLSYKKISDAGLPDSLNKKTLRMNPSDENSGQPSRDSILLKYIEDSRSLVYKHTVKATDIIEDLISDDSSRVYGLLYSLEGNAASSMQFYLTDSTNHFVRGALYFNVATNVDSLFPVIRYIQDDILHFVNTFEWKQKI